jgi:hypothetical protein
MANQVAARLKGDDYQHLTTWLHVLEILRPRLNVRSVTIEDETAGSADDVTVRHETGSGLPDRFYQIKFHTAQQGSYSTEILTEFKGNGTSLLQKLFATWKKLQAETTTSAFEIHLVSNWSWDVSDKAGGCFDGQSNRVTDRFFMESQGSAVGKNRQAWKTHLAASDDEFELFVRTLHFDLGSTCFDERTERARDQMEERHLKHNDAALLAAIGVVRSWIKAGRQEITREILMDAIKENDLVAPNDAEMCVTILLTTVKKQRIDIEPEYTIDWRDKFEGPGYEKGHSVFPGVDWNRDLLPELRDVESRVSEATGCRLVRARGLARLSAWFGFGRTFSENARYTIEVDQQGQLWRSDAKPSVDFCLLPTNAGGELIEGDPGVVAVGISVTSSIECAVRKFLSESGSASHLLLLNPNRELGRECLRDAGDAVALARSAKDHLRSFVQSAGAKRVLLFYLGPLSGACFMGHSLNSIGAPVRIMEFQEPGYAATFEL